MKGFRVTVEEVRAVLERGAKIIFIDARTKTDWELSGSKVKGAIRIPLDEIERRLDEIPRYCTVITY